LQAQIGKRLRIAIHGSQRMRTRQCVGEGAIGLMARNTRDVTVRRKARIEKKLAAEIDCVRLA